MAKGICSVDGCERYCFGYGRCKLHYRRFLQYGSTGTPPTRTLEGRFWAKVEKTDTCWLWTGAQQDRGYGRIWSGPPAGRFLMVHRVSWELANGPIPDGLQIDHLCKNTSCVNPAHLEPVTPVENTRRSSAAAVRAALKLARTHCKWGHERSPENTRILNAAGDRECRICRIERKRRYRLERKARELVEV